MADALGTQRNGSEGVQHNDNRLANSHSGQYGVSDDRRAELSKMEQDAGVEHEAADESVRQQPRSEKERAAGHDAEAGAARPGDRH